MAPQTYAVGDRVEVWSNGQSRWVPNAVVRQAPKHDCQLEGYDVKGGALKVEYEGNSKWLLPDMVATSVRRAPGSASSSTPVTPHCQSIDSRPRCKLGCGRAVQPGLTRGMKLFDTCCKACAMCGGKGDHDSNCGGVQPALVAGRTKSEIGDIDPYVWLKGLVESEAALQTHCEAVFERAASGQRSMTLEQFKSSVKDLLLQPVGAQLHSTEETLRDIFHKYDTTRTGFDVTAFTKISKGVLADYYNGYFPERLKCKTKDFVRKSKKGLREVYDVGAKLGEGSFGQVHLVTHKVSREKRVCKMIQKYKGRTGMPLNEILAEIESMAMLDHPNVIKVYEYFEDDEAVTQIMEPCNGGELQDRIDDMFKHKRVQYGEEFICDVMKQTLRALAFMHNERFMHKDLKPQNIMMVDKDSSSVKLIDFGLAELFESDKKVSETFGGTLLYIAPEGFGGGLEMKSDVWSAGVILYNLITGDYPFMETWPLPPGKDISWWQCGVQRAIERDKYRSHMNLTNAVVSQECVQLLDMMLTKNPEQRPNAAQCLDHDWFKKFSRPPPPLSVGVTQCLDAFAGQSELKKAVFLLIAHQCTLPALQELRAIFTHFDTQNRGTLSSSSIREVMQQSGMSMLRAAKILHALDRDDSGAVSWTEFIAAALCVSVSQNKPLVTAAFATVDQDGDDRVSVQDFLDVFAKGAEESIWARRLPAECAAMVPGGAPGSRTFTKDQFMAFIGDHMRVIAGDAVSAVR